MSISDYVLAAFVYNGLPLLFAVILIASIGVPFIPTTLTLLAAGSLVEQGELKMGSVVAVATLAAVLGDGFGYTVARWGGRPWVLRQAARMGAMETFARAEILARRHGDLGIFFTRWLATAAGPWVNVASGLTHYPRRRFLFWVVMGETLWVGLFVTLGYHFSDRVQAVGELLSDLAVLVVGLIVTALLAWQLVRSFRSQERST